MTPTLREIFELYRSSKKRTGQRSEVCFREIERYIDSQEKSGNLHLTYRSILKWQAKRRHVLSDYSFQERYLILYRFSKWAHLIDSNNEELPKRKRRFNGRRIPIILSPVQVSEIVERMKNTCPFRPFSAHTYSTLVGLMYTTGMRSSEALINLSDDDVNLEEGYIYVRASKSARDRYIPISKTTATKLRQYRSFRESQFPRLRERFFRLYKDVPKSPHSFRSVFASVTADLGYRSPDQFGQKSLALVPHDLRHSFTTNTVHRFHKEGLNLETELAKLSVVLGHYSIRETYWYVESIPELLTIILKKGAKNAL